MEIDLSNISGVGGADQAMGNGATDDAYSMNMQKFEEIMNQLSQLQLPEDIQKTIAELITAMMEHGMSGNAGDGIASAGGAESA